MEEFGKGFNNIHTDNPYSTEYMQGKQYRESFQQLGKIQPSPIQYDGTHAIGMLIFGGFATFIAAIIMVTEYNLEQEHIKKRTPHYIRERTWTQFPEKTFTHFVADEATIYKKPDITKKHSTISKDGCVIVSGYASAKWAEISYHYGYEKRRSSTLYIQRSSIQPVPKTHKCFDR